MATLLKCEQVLLKMELSKSVSILHVLYREVEWTSVLSLINRKTKLVFVSFDSFLLDL